MAYNISNAHFNFFIRNDQSQEKKVLIQFLALVQPLFLINNGNDSKILSKYAGRTSLLLLT